MSSLVLPDIPLLIFRISLLITLGNNRFFSLYLFYQSDLVVLIADLHVILSSLDWNVDLLWTKDRTLLETFHWSVLLLKGSLICAKAWVHIDLALTFLFNFGI